MFIKFDIKTVSFVLIIILLVSSLLSVYVFYLPGEGDSDGELQKEKQDVYDLNLSEIQDSLDRGIDWLIFNFKDKGCFYYIYDPSTGEYSTNNNMIRQLMASRVLAEISHNNDTLEGLHQKNLDFMFNYWYKEEADRGYIYYNSKSKLGAIGMALRTLVYSPFFDNYTEEAKKLVNSILYLQNEDGSLEPWYIEPSYDYDKDYLLTFYSGEAILSLVEYYLKTSNESILDAAILSQDYYVDRYVYNLEENYYPAYVPWHSQSLNKLYKITGNDEYADAIMIMNDELLNIQDYENNETIGRFYNASLPQYGSSHSSSDGVYTEGLAYAYEIAALLNDTDHMQKYEDAVVLGVYNLISLQYTAENVGSYDYPERLIGGMRYNIDDGRIRIDTTQHTIDAFMKILLVFE